MKILLSPGNVLRTIRNPNKSSPPTAGRKPWLIAGDFVSDHRPLHNPNEALYFNWTTEDGSNWDYGYNPTTAAASNNQLLAIIGTVSINGLRGGVYYNKLVRPNLFIKY